MKKVVKVVGVVLGVICTIGGIFLFKLNKGIKDFDICEFGD